MFESEVGSDVFEYDFGKHESGVYFVRIMAKNGVMISKVTVH